MRSCRAGPPSSHPGRHSCPRIQWSVTRPREVRPRRSSRQRWPVRLVVLLFSSGSDPQGAAPVRRPLPGQDGYADVRRPDLACLRKHASLRSSPNPSLKDGVYVNIGDSVGAHSARQPSGSSQRRGQKGRTASTATCNLARKEPDRRLHAGDCPSGWSRPRPPTSRSITVLGQQCSAGRPWPRELEGHAGWAPGEPSSITNDARVRTGAPGVVTTSTTRKSTVHAAGVTTLRT
jgi:hypothetical protein